MQRNKQDAASMLAEIEALKQRIAKGTPAPTIRGGKVPRSKLVTCTAVFQHRSGNQSGSESHIDGLRRAIERSNGRPLDPITVFWVGDAWCCLDGHHRLDAYEEANYRNAIPVRPFEGSLEAAIAFALRSNSKDKLAMSSAEKSNGAWRLVIATGLSKSAIAEAGRVSERTVASMREAMRKLSEHHPGVALDALAWWQARRIADGLEVDLEKDTGNWMAEAAQALADRLSKTFGTRLGKHPEVTAMALELYSAQLARELTSYLPSPHEEFTPEQSAYEAQQRESHERQLGGLTMPF